MPDASVAAPNRAKEYEAIYVLRPDIDSDAATKISTRLSEVIARENGSLVKVESWGRRKLAYPVRKFRRGIYFFLRFVGSGGIVAELERNFRMQRDAVLKFMTVKVNDEVDAGALKIDPEEIKFAAIEPPGEDDADESREKELGLIDYHDSRGSRDRGMHRGMDDDDDADDDAGDDDVVGMSTKGDEEN